MRRLHFHLPNPVSVRPRSFRSRVWMVIALMSMAGLILGWRVLDLQVLQHDSLSRMAQRQSQRIFKRQGKRGAITDREGGVLALSLKAKSFYAHPQLIQNPADTAYKLAAVLGLPRRLLERKLSSQRPFVWIKRQATPRQTAALNALKLEGIGSLSDYRRIYPARERAAALLGFTGIDSQGLEGLEYAYDSYLRGTERIEVVDVDALGRTVVSGEEHPPAAGGNLTLTIHPAIQYFTERELARAVEQSEAKVGVAIVLHSPTGEILAMAQAPGFNPNRYQSFDKSTFFNRAITSGYEPGSTFKVITFAATLESGAVEPDSLFFCEEGSFEHYDSVIHDTAPHGWLTLQRIIEVSSNICTAKVGMSMPKRAFHEYITRFGFGRRPGIFTAPGGRRLAGEAEGYVLPAEKWTPVDHAAISFGHGILVSPLQMTLAVNTIATGGKLMKPLLVKEIRDPGGKVIQSSRPASVGRVISPETASVVRDFMVGVVSKRGTGSRAALPGYSVAGKTGTTEKYDIKARGYSKTRLIASFVGFVPADRPVLTILVLIEEPQRGRAGGIVAAPVFRKIAASALPVLGVWPEPETSSEPPGPATTRNATDGPTERAK